MPRRALALLLLLLAPAGAGADGTPTDAPAPPTLPASIPSGPAPRVDGVEEKDEWTGVLVPFRGHVLRFQRNGDTLYASFSSPAEWPRGGHLVLRLLPGGDETSRDAVRVDFEPREHDRAHLIVARGQVLAEEVVPRGGVARARFGGPTYVEMALRLPALGIAADVEARRDVLVQWWGADDAPTELGATDLGWTGDVAPPQDWDRLVAEDEELTRRGETAHDAAFLIGEEPNLKKRDSELGPDLFENLAWVAEREPLTPKDLVALATGHRFVNRPGEALALLDGVAADPAWRDADALLYQRALCLRALERFDDAAATWMRLHAHAPDRGYDRTAALERDRAKAFEAERTARAEDAGSTDLPLVLLRTDRGEILVQLFARDVPKATAHFLSLVEARSADGKPTYEGTCFHRVIGGYLAQGGDPASRIEGCERGGTGEPPAIVEAERNPRHGFWRGAVGFARGQAPENGSEIFLLTAPRPELGERGFTCFGRVLAGMEAADRLEWGDRLLEVRILSRGR
jgi:cyclophilin family peptidyl-prolyl cis-trans isomerase